MSYKDISNLIRGAVYFSEVPPPTYATLSNRHAFTLTLSSPLTSENIIHLYSQFSRSIPYDAVTTKWKHLVPRWRFLDEDGTVVNSIVADSTVIYSSGVAIGTTGTANFYYVDDMPCLENSPVLLWATLELSGLVIDDTNIELPGYSNSNVIAVTPYYINSVKPELLKITRNGRDDIHDLKWESVPFQYFVTINGHLTGCWYGDQYPIIFDYPQTNVIGSQYTINREISGMSSDSVVWNPVLQNFQRTDVNGLYVGGFVRGSVTASTSSESTVISANAQISYTNNSVYTPFVWISNPENRTINKITVPWTNLSQEYYDAYLYFNPYLSPSAINEFVYDAPYIQEIDPTNTWSFSGYGGIFGIAVDPCYDVWAADAEMDYIYKFNVMGELVSSIALNDYTEISGVSAGCTPASISIDGNKNVYVSLFDSVSVLKFDSNGTFLYMIAPSSFSLDSLGNEDSMPTKVVTDTNNNIWVAYSNNTNSKITHFTISDLSATENFTIDLTLSATPIDIGVDNSDDSIWVTNAYSHQTSGNIQKYDTTGQLLCSLDYVTPNFITIDDNNYVWTGYGYNNVVCIPVTGTPIQFSISGGLIKTDINYDYYNDTIIGGIASDSQGYIWIINSLENVVYRVSATTDFDALTSSLMTLTILPCSNELGWAISTPLMTYYTYTDINARSAQAYGDWTGYEWFRKYLVTSQSEILSGTSNEFEIRSFENNSVIRRFNESWDAADQMHDYALSDHIYAHYNLFENYLKAMVGGNETEDQHIGRLSYEKIANFVKNHRDVEEANVKQLYSLANEIDVPIDDYNFTYPVDISRMLDIASISHQKLWGSRCKCQENYTQNSRGVCKNCNHYHCSNLGSELSTLTYTVTANTPFLVRKKNLDSEFQKIIPVEYNSLSSYPLSSVSSISWLTSSDFIYYNFYTYYNTFCDTQIEGVINWDDEYTTLSETNSSIDEWYKEGGLVEQMFDYYLHKGLNL